MDNSHKDRDDLLQEAFEFGQEAQFSGSQAQAFEEFSQRFGDDPELHSFFMRGLTAPPSEVRHHTGRLLQHGAAKFNGDPSERMSYYVTLETDRGPETVWGKDLKRALQRSKLQVGDLVMVTNKGKTPVKVQANRRDENGTVVGKEWIVAERNTWAAQPWTPQMGAVQNLAHRSPTAPALGGTSTEIFPAAPGAVSPVRIAGRVAPPTVSFMGTKGAQGLGNMLKAGGTAVRTTITGFAFDRANEALLGQVAQVQTELSALSSGALAGLSDASLTETGRKALIDDFFNTPEHRQRFNALTANLDRVQELSAKVVVKGLDNGLDGETLVKHAVDPIKRLLNDNESLLKSLNEGNGSLYDQISDAITGIFAYMRELLTKAIGFIAGQTSTQASKARMGS